MIFLDDKTIIFNSSNIKSIKEIPPGNWLVKFDSFKKEYFLERQKDFIIPDKIYGNIQKTADKFINTFNHKNGNLGIILSGLKGTGKSLLSKLICKNINLPVLIINDSYSGTEFIDFLSQIPQKVVIFIDEFEKIYKREDDSNIDNQETLLTILDGAINTSKFLFLFTINNLYLINNYFINRPGRIHYIKEYKGIDRNTTIDICNDLLNNKEDISKVLSLYDFLDDISIDIILCLISEFNLYPDIPLLELLEDLNISPESSNYIAELYKDNILLATDKSCNHPMEYNSVFDIKYYHNDNACYEYINFPMDELTATRNSNNEIVYNYNNMVLIFKKNPVFDKSRFII